MSSDLEERVSELLSAVREAFESGAVPMDVDADSLEATGEDGDLADRAAEARELVETNEPNDLLEAVGLAELPDGSEPSSIPEAIARGPEERVRDLHALVTLANLDEWGDGEGADELEAALSDLRETLGIGETDGDEATESEAEDGEAVREDDGGAEAEAAEREESDEGGTEGVEGGGADETDDEAEDDSEADESDSTVEETLKAAAGTTFEQFSDDVESLRARLESLSGDAEDEAEDDAEDEAEADEEDEADDEGDDGTFDFGDGFGDESRRSHLHSTMAPPPSRRADMRAVRRHSTMPDRR